MNHLESLIYEYLDWRGYLTKRNIKVGKLKHGGWAMELDVVGYHPISKHLIHYESSIDGHSWIEREKRFRAKFENGEQYILAELFPWLEIGLVIDKVAICVTHPKGKDTVGGGRLQSVDELLAEVRSHVIQQGSANSKAISEIYPLLRTMQLTHCGYNKAFQYQD